MTIVQLEWLVNKEKPAREILDQLLSTYDNSNIGLKTQKLKA